MWLLLRREAGGSATLFFFITFCGGRQRLLFVSPGYTPDFPPPVFFPLAPQRRYDDPKKKVPAWRRVVARYGRDHDLLLLDFLSRPFRVLWSVARGRRKLEQGLMDTADVTRREADRRHRELALAQAQKSRAPKLRASRQSPPSADAHADGSGSGGAAWAPGKLESARMSAVSSTGRLPRVLDVSVIDMSSAGRRSRPGRTESAPRVFRRNFGSFARPETPATAGAPGERAAAPSVAGLPRAGSALAQPRSSLPVRGSNAPGLSSSNGDDVPTAAQAAVVVATVVPPPPLQASSKSILNRTSRYGQPAVPALLRRTPSVGYTDVTPATAAAATAPATATSGMDAEMLARMAAAEEILGLGPSPSEVVTCAEPPSPQSPQPPLQATASRRRSVGSGGGDSSVLAGGATRTRRRSSQSSSLQDPGASPPPGAFLTHRLVSPAPGDRGSASGFFASLFRGGPTGGLAVSAARASAARLHDPDIDSVYDATVADARRLRALRFTALLFVHLTWVRGEPF